MPGQALALLFQRGVHPPFGKGRVGGLFGADGVARLVQADRDGRMDAAYTIFAVVCVEVWCRIFLDRGV
jgi:hypothetical protein